MSALIESLKSDASEAAGVWEKVCCFQYTAIDNATRVRALKVNEKHTRANANSFTIKSSRSSHFAYVKFEQTTA